MKKHYNKFLIVSTLIIGMGFTYIHFSNNLSSEIIPVASGSTLANSAGIEPLETSVTQSEKISSDISFLTTLVTLKKIKIDTSIFQNNSFNKLENNSVKIEQVTPGRINPFAPIGSSSLSTSVSASKVVTDQPTQITDKTVVFNGTINATGVTDAYFEYGTTQALGAVTATVKQSLVGTFIKNVLGLSPKTNYYYKACAKVNNVVLCGDVVSFVTN